MKTTAMATATMAALAKKTFFVCRNMDALLR